MKINVRFGMNWQDWYLGIGWRCQGQHTKETPLGDRFVLCVQIGPATWFIEAKRAKPE